MSWFAKAALAGITSFAATNIDDIAILILFFLQLSPTFCPRHIVIGQFASCLCLTILVKNDEFKPYKAIVVRREDYHE